MVSWGKCKERRKMQLGERIDASVLEKMLQTRFGKSVHTQVIHPKSENRQLVLVEGIRVERRATAGGVRRICQRIAAAFGGELYGTVNLDFSSEDEWTAEMLAEVPSAESCLP